MAFALYLRFNMPRYDYVCQTCGKEEERVERIADVAVECGCGKGIMLRKFSPPAHIITDIEPYYDQHLAGQDGVPVYVKSRQHKKALLKERGLEYRR